jgi:hypothetical protein
MNNWNELPDEKLTGNGYQNILRGWRNTVTGAEVLTYRVEGTGMEDVTDKEFAVQHPTDDDGEHTYFFDDEDEAEDHAEEYMNSHPTPEQQ